ncbi:MULTISPECIES: peptidoglycan-binding domain-containing protein [Streptomyces]|uniref:Peptidoglycan-binding domain-containing protein n=1 Tax=Streptomyces flaveolus TaxID=67297 RepID=A0ABV1VT35_9ACTN
MHFRKLAIAATVLPALLSVGNSVVASAAEPSPANVSAAASCSIYWKTSGGYSGFTAGYSWAWNTEVSQGATGNMVREIQCLLNNSAWYEGAKLSVDGDFGPATRSAVWRVQSLYHSYHPSFPVDGIVGPKTWRLLRSA